ncbi:MAG TPA: hypothetical protein ENI52_03990 [Thermoplasmata archaeon]|nr:hypothetical protein [Thermoplasmata archaeon]
MYRSYRRDRERNIEKALCGWIFRTAQGIERIARNNAPRGVTGDLRRSTKAFLQYPVSTVSIGARYAKFVEGFPQPTRRHFHSWEHDYGFRKWAQRRGFDTSRIQGGLLVWGYATKFFQKAIETIKPKAEADLRRCRI